MDFIKEFNRDQLIMMDFESFVSMDSWARIVDLFVEMLPLDSLEFKDVLNSEGRPSFHSNDMIKLYLYSYKNQLRSSRKLAHACKVNLEVIWLLKGLKPSARKITYFRKNNAKSFKQTFRYFVILLKDMNLIDGKTIAIDSFKIRTQNSLKNNFNQKKIDRHIQYIEDKIQDYQNQLEQEDLVDKEEIKQKHRKQLIKSELTQISLTDPDARSVILHRNIVNVGYCVQAGCDSKHNLFINNDTGTVNDTHALSPMTLDAKKY